MKIVNTALNQVDLVAALLQKFIEDFNRLSLDERMSRSQTVFSALRSFFDEQAVIQKAALETHPAREKSFEAYNTTQQDMQAIYDDMLFRHVDDAEYLQQLRALRKAFDHFTRTGYQDLMCAIQADFSDAEEEHIVALLK